MNWSWYLANDMQFFLIGLFLLILSDTWVLLIYLLLLIMYFARINMNYKFQSFLHNNHHTGNSFNRFYYADWLYFIYLPIRSNVSNKNLAIYEINFHSFNFQNILFYYRPFELYNFLNVLYYPPWIRIGPYIIGMITAYILMKLNYKLTLKRVQYNL